MNTKIIWFVVAIVVLVGVIYFGVQTFWSDQNEVGVQSNNVSTSTADMIRVDLPLPNVLVESPLVVRGQARGSWYFEASFPVRIFDSNGKQLGVVPAQAEGNWMTNDFVPFSATLRFDAPTTETGTVVFEKDNPSGLPANDASVSIPIYFSNNASKL